ncbi:helix-turn-helix domain-containing protein [Flavobacterium sp. '19STA2R22 D10 B1']|uniref:helix-turn-helix domain-containing protein n=1 Tax=Flavobacterium aerium TaxID=3037261 RepID=UPI00278BE64F|nr:helix-turn-helix domain-containing protein [Flavobacterium sp. '19STA2R22 D10 B1']
MENWTMFVDFILIAGISLLGLNILFLSKAKTHFSQKLLIVFFANALFFLLYYYAYTHRSKLLGAIAVFFGNGMGFILGPLLLFLLKSLVLPKAQYIHSLYKHLIPFGLLWLFVSLPLSISMATDHLTEYGNWYAQHDYYFNLVENVFFLVYVILAFQLLMRIQKASRENYSSVKKNNLNWYKHLLIGIFLIIILDTLCTVYELFFPMIPWNIGTLIAFSFVFLYVYLGYKGMFQAQILIPDFLLQKLSITEKTEEVPQEIETPVQKALVRQLDNYTPEEIEKLKQELFDILENKKLYLNDALSLTELAEEMNISNKKLSELLNQYVNISFYNLINQYRVTEVIERMMLDGSDKYTLMGIAYESGFQSKASFNRIFKQKTGVSPSKYKKDLEAKNEAI